MTITPIESPPPKAPACFGVCCQHHGTCARYAAVNGSQANPKTIGTCMTHDSYPLYQPLEAEQDA